MDVKTERLCKSSLKTTRIDHILYYALGTNTAEMDLNRAEYVSGNQQAYCRNTFTP